MFKTALIGCFLLTTAGVSACAHVERVGFDATNRSVRYCGNKHADQADVENAARRECSAQRFALRGCMREQVGSKAATFNLGDGVSVTNIKPTYGVCCDFECGN